MKKNESTVDRIVRAVIAVIAGGGAIATHGVLSIVLWVVAAIMGQLLPPSVSARSTACSA